jgi:DNA replication and repair protein RecO
VFRCDSKLIILDLDTCTRRIAGPVRRGAIAIRFMRERVYRNEAIILRRTDFAEADRLLLIATLLGSDGLLLKVHAK